MNRLVDPACVGFTQGSVPPCCVCGKDLNGKHKITTLSTNRTFTICDDCYDEHEGGLIACGVCHRVFLKSEAKLAYIKYPWGDDDDGHVVNSCPTCAPDGYHALSTHDIEHVVPAKSHRKYKTLAYRKIEEYRDALEAMEKEVVND